MNLNFQIMDGKQLYMFKYNDVWVMKVQDILILIRNELKNSDYQGIAI